MITPWNVLARLKHFINIGSESTDSALSLCFVNLERILSQIKESSDKNDPRITEAAAALSYYDYAVKSVSESDGSITSFKAGDVTVSRTSQSLIEIASDIKKQALEDIIPLLKDEEFFFKSV